jgi:hypothetical protein
VKGSFQSRLLVKLASLVAALVLGIGSAYQGLAALGNRPVENNPLWTIRTPANDESALPYILGHYLTHGQLPPPLSVQDFHRLRDDDQVALRGSCVVEITGEIPAARWWTISATTQAGVAPTDSNTLTAATALLESDGKLILRVSASPQPGNWIKPPANGAYAIALALHDAAGNGQLTLPRVKQVSC